MPRELAADHYISRHDERLLISDIQDIQSFLRLTKDQRVKTIEATRLSPEALDIMALDVNERSLVCQGVPLLLEELSLEFNVDNILDGVDGKNEAAEKTRALASRGIYNFLVHARSLRHLQIEFTISGGFAEALPAVFKEVVPGIAFFQLRKLALRAFVDTCNRLPEFIRAHRVTLECIELKDIHIEGHSLGELFQTLDKSHAMEYALDGVFKGDGEEINFNDRPEFTGRLEKALVAGCGEWMDILCEQLLCKYLNRAYRGWRFQAGCKTLL